MPRWTRKYWTPQTAAGLALAIFSAGSWVGTYLTAPDVRGITASVGVLTKNLSEIKELMGPTCQHGCLLKREDISLMDSHVADLWAKKNRTEQEAERPVEYKRYTVPPRKGKTR